MVVLAMVVFPLLASSQAAGQHDCQLPADPCALITRLHGPLTPADPRATPGFQCYGERYADVILMHAPFGGFAEQMLSVFGATTYARALGARLLAPPYYSDQTPTHDVGCDAFYDSDSGAAAAAALADGTAAPWSSALNGTRLAEVGVLELSPPQWRALVDSVRALARGPAAGGKGPPAGGLVATQLVDGCKERLSACASHVGSCGRNASAPCVRRELDATGAAGRGGGGGGRRVRVVRFGAVFPEWFGHRPSGACCRRAPALSPPLPAALAELARAPAPPPLSAALARAFDERPGVPDWFRPNARVQAMADAVLAQARRRSRARRVGCAHLPLLSNGSSGGATADGGRDFGSAQLARGRFARLAAGWLRAQLGAGKAVLIATDSPAALLALLPMLAPRAAGGSGCADEGTCALLERLLADEAPPPAEREGARRLTVEAATIAACSAADDHALFLSSTSPLSIMIGGLARSRAVERARLLEADAARAPAGSAARAAAQAEAGRLLASLGNAQGIDMRAGTLLRPRTDAEREAEAAALSAERVSAPTASGRPRAELARTQTLDAQGEALSVSFDRLSFRLRGDVYWCLPVRLSAALTSQFVATDFAPHFASEGNFAVHHITLWSCDDEREQHAQPARPFPCTRRPIPPGCGSIVYSWNYGMAPFAMPAGTGVLLPSRAMLQVHYTLASVALASVTRGLAGAQAQLAAAQPVSDSSGLRIALRPRTPALKLFHFFELGPRFGTIQVPPNAQHHWVTSVCAPECIRESLARTGAGVVEIIALVQHMHLAGRTMVVDVIRADGGGQLIGNAGRFAIAHTPMELLPEPVVLRAGDALRVRCEYNTTGRRRDTVLGPLVTDEMCFAYMLLSPADPDFSHCSHIHLEPAAGAPDDPRKPCVPVCSAAEAAAHPRYLRPAVTLPAQSAATRATHAGAPWRNCGSPAVPTSLTLTL